MPCFQEGKFIVEVGLNERGLVTIPTKALNKLMKDNNVSKEDRKRIKERRRTLLNRYVQKCEKLYRLSAARQLGQPMHSQFRKV